MACHIAKAAEADPMALQRPGCEAVQEWNGGPIVQPTQIGLRYDPPALVIEYVDAAQSFGCLREVAAKPQHRVLLDPAKLVAYPAKDLVVGLKGNSLHGPYVQNVQEEQLEGLLGRLRAVLLEEESRRGSPLGSMQMGGALPSRAGGQRPRRGRSAAPTLRSRAHPAPAGGQQVAAAEEGWPAAAWATWCLQSANGAAPATAGVQESFEAFRTSRGVQDIAASFADLLRCCAGEEAQPSALDCPMVAIRKAVGSQRRFARALWETLDAQTAKPDYADRPLLGRRAVVVGAGPTGLRCALELRLLGAEVVVLEKRTAFDRINRLHLWKWCGEDLKSWGAKILEPPELSFGSDPDFLHIGIAELQMLLLKPCLLLGVQVLLGAEFRGAEPGGRLGWQVHAAAAGGAPPCGPGLPPGGCLQGVSLLVGADGPRSVVVSSLAFPTLEAAALRKEGAIGLVANFTNLQSAAEKGRRPFALARQFYEAMFAGCERETGLALENIVCYISAQTHYFVMTPTKRSLQSLGVIRADAQEGAALDSVDQEALSRVVRQVAAYPWKPDQREDPPLPEAVLSSPAAPPALFDFSRTRRACAGLKVVRGRAGAEGSAVSEMLVGLCGDALIEPFWPEGLGVVRGFFAALDLASACKVWAQTGDTEAATAHFEAAYRQLKSLAAQTRGRVLREEAGFALDPSTRYRSFGCGGGGGGLARSSSTPAVCRA